MKHAQTLLAELVALGGLLAILMSTPSAQALGVGPSIGYGLRAGRVVEVDDEDKMNILSSSGNIGILLDTNVARNSLFNYRLEVTFELAGVHWKTKEFDPSVTAALGDVKFPAFGWAMRHSADFGILRSTRLRLFVGPSLRVAMLIGSGTPTDASVESPAEVTFLQVDAGIGPEVGVNFHVSRNLSLTGTFNYYPQLAYGGVDDPNRPYENDKTHYGYLGVMHQVSVRFGVLFRSASDVFQRR